MIDMKYTNPEETRLMILYKNQESERCGYSLGNDAYLEWVDKFANAFRNWADTIPENCVNCGMSCQKDTTKCINPFNTHRIHYLHKDSTSCFY